MHISTRLLQDIYNNVMKDIAPIVKKRLSILYESSDEEEPFDITELDFDYYVIKDKRYHKFYIQSAEQVAFRINHKWSDLSDIVYGSDSIRSVINYTKRNNLPVENDKDELNYAERHSSQFEDSLVNYENDDILSLYHYYIYRADYDGVYCIGTEEDVREYGEEAEYGTNKYADAIRVLVGDYGNLNLDYDFVLPKGTREINNPNECYHEYFSMRYIW